LIVFAEPEAEASLEPGVVVLLVAATEDVISPGVFTVFLQRLAYHVAVLKGAC